MPAYLILFIISFVLRILYKAFHQNSSKAYFIPSVSWYKAGVKTNLREEYKFRSRF